MKAESEAIAHTMPAASDASTDPTRARAFAVTPAGSTGVIDIGSTSCWVTVTADVDVTLRSSTSNSLTAAVANDWPIWGKSYHCYWVDKDRYVRFIGLLESGTAWIYVSSR